MPTTASIELKNASYVAETTPGTTPGSPTMLELWCNELRLNLDQEVLKSARRLGDGQTKGLRLGRKQVSGSVQCDLTADNHDDMLEALFGSTFPTAFTQVSGTDIAFVNSSSEITQVAAGFGSIAVGDWIIVDGSTSNDGYWYVTAAAAGALTVSDPVGDTTITDESAGASVTVDQDVRMENGTTLTTFTIEGRYTDIAKYMVATGVTVNSGTFEANSQLATMSLDLLGWDMAAPSGSSLGTPTAGTDNEPFDSLGTSPQIAGSDARLTNVKMQINRNRTLSKPLGSRTTDESRKGGIEVTGSFSEYFEASDTNYAKYIAGTKVSLSWTFEDPAGNQYIFYVYEALITDAPEETDDDAIVHNYSFTAQRESTTSKTVAVAKISA